MGNRLNGPAVIFYLVLGVTHLVAVAFPAQEDRIATPDEVERAMHPPAFFLLRAVSVPPRLLAAGMEKGLIKYEATYQRQRTALWLQALRNRGIALYFGGVGEGTGFGGGAGYTVGGKRTSLSLVGRLTTAKYQEFDVAWTSSMGLSRLIVEGSYQWRPRENFYGIGQKSVREQHSNFALRQTWAGVRYEITPYPWISWGSEYRTGWFETHAGTNPALASPEAFFPDLPGYGRQTTLQSVGSYLSLDGIRGDYQLGGALHTGASHQDGLGARNRLSYFTYEVQLEGRLPVLRQRSAFVGLASLEFNRRRSGSDPIPFYLLPRIGGSSTLRGFGVDRFSGTNLLLLSLEYRYRLHPNVEAVPFFDEGQIFDRTDDLTWLNWHRNYGFGFRYHTETGTVVRIELGHSSEGLQFHILFGDRQRPPLRGPTRYGAYKR